MSDESSPDNLRTTEREDVSAEVEDLVESEPIIKVFDNPGAVRIMLALVDTMGNPLPVSDIADVGGITRQTFYNNEERLLRYDLIEQVDKIGNAKRYRAKMESEPVQGFIHLYDAMIEAAG